MSSAFTGLSWIRRRAGASIVGVVGAVVLLGAALVWASGCGADGDGGSTHTSNQKVISNASLQVEVEAGTFQTAFEQVRLLADKYGGYMVSAESTVSGKESVMRSGVVAIRVPAQSLNPALEDVSRLGRVTAQQVDSQDVTEGYVDLEASVKTVQREVEQFTGRLTCLDEDSGFSILTVSLYETVVVTTTAGGGWGLVEALKDAARALVRTVNELIVFLGGAVAEGGRPEAGASS